VKESSMTDPDILDLIKKVETIRSEPGDAKEYEEYTDGWIDACNSVLDLLHSGLAQPEPQGPTDEELLDAFDQAVAAFPPVHPEAEPLSAVEYARELEIRRARAVLARWGRPTSKESLND
jgi:hypothetical protein